MLHRGIWRTEVQLRINELRNRLAVLEASGKTNAAVEKCLDTAQAVLDAPSDWRGSMSAWWSGSAMTTAWGSVHEAEARLVADEGDEAVLAALPRLLDWVQRAMNGEAKVRHENSLKQQIEKGEPQPVAIQQAYYDVIAANSDRYSNLRAFRNTLVLVTSLLGALMLLLALVHLADPDFISLCTDAGTERSCLAGEEPGRGDLLALLLLGAVGGLLAIAFGLAETHSPPSRYDPKTWQLILKPVAGAATALAGVLLVQSDVVVGPTSTPSEALFLGYAIIFGFSQQLLTRFVDKRAGALVESDGKSGSEGAAP